PVPPAATTRQKVLHARLSAGLVPAAGYSEAMRIGRWWWLDAILYPALIPEIAATGAALDGTAAGAARWHRGAVERLLAYEAFITARVRAGTDPPWSANLARAARLAEEAELIRADDRAARDPGPRPPAPPPVAGNDRDPVPFTAY